MTFFSILIALIIERLAPQFAALRQFQWLRDYSLWISEVLHLERLNGWLGFSVVLFPIVVLAWLLTGMFENALFGLFELAFGVVVVFFCLGPREMDRQIDQYLDAIELDDSEQRAKVASNILLQTPAQDLSGQVTQVSQSLFIEANMRIFSILFWFALFGPVAAVFYRVVERLMRGQMLDSSMSQLRQALRMSLGVLDWVPARITLFGFMLSGSFDAGLAAYRQDSVIATDLFENNQELLKSVGYHCIDAHSVESNDQALSVIRKTRGLILRSLIVWLLVVIIISLMT